MRVTITTKKSIHAKKFGKLIFDDGTVIDGEGFGFQQQLLVKLYLILVWLDILKL
jgi:hypothetical protein